MGTAGGSGADPGRGTHSRSELTTPHLSHLAQALNVQQLLKKKIWHSLADFGPQDRPELADRPRRPPERTPDERWRLGVARAPSHPPGSAPGAAGTGPARLGQA